MSHFRYTAARKVEAVRRVVEDGCSVCAVARESGVSEGSLFFWVRRYRQLVPGIGTGRRALHAPPAERPAGARSEAKADIREVGTLVAYLRRAAR